MLNKKIKRSLSCVLLLSAALCFMSTPEKADAINFNGISDQNSDYYLYYGGKVYLWGYYSDEERGKTYENKWGKWADPRPQYENDTFWNNQDVVGDRSMGSLAEWGFETYWSEWDGSRINGNADTGGNTNVEYQRKATYWFKRFKNYPETKGVLAWGESYTSPDGNVHWQRPGQTMRVQVDNFQDYPGWRIQLDDYVNLNYIQLVNNSGNIAKNYANIEGKTGAYEWLPEVTMTNNWNGQSADKQWFYTQFDVTITGGENDYRIDTYAASANGKEVGYNSSGEYIKIDNSEPSGIWSSTATENVWTNQNVVLKFQPTDARSGVKKWSYRTSTNNGATYSGYSAIITGGDAKDFTVTTEGKNIIISDISDNVNWYNKGVPSEAYWIDKTAPTANAVASSTDWTNADVTLSVNSAADTLSGLDGITLPNNTKTTSTSASQVVSANASYTFAIRDIAGNVTNKTITVGNIDKVAPTANNVTASTTAWTNSNVTLTLTGAADALSGFSKIVLPDGTSTTSTSATYSAAANGTFTFKVYDKAGNVTNKSITVTNIDKIAPTVTMPGTIQNETTDYFDVVATNVADAGSGIDRVQFPTWTTLNGQDDIQSSWTTNSAASGVGVGTTYTYRVNRSAHNWEFGNYNVHVYVYDKAGNATSFEMPVHNKKDMTPPNVLTAGNDPAWTTSKTIVVSASDEHTGLTNIKTPNGTTILNTGKGVVSSQSHVVNANGNFVYSATDKYGNTTSRTVAVSSVDTQAPTGTEYGNPTAWTNANFDMGIKDIVESQSGYDHATLPNSTTTTSTNPWQTITANGTYSFTLYDKVGNSKTYTEVVTKIDKAAPTGTITASPTNWTNGNVTLTLNANDTGGSGIYRIKDDAGNYTIGASDTFTVSANGTYDFTVYDNAGNSKVVSYTVSNIDKTSPGLTVTQNPSAWTKGEVTLTGAASDSQSGLVSIRETNTGIYAGRNLIPKSTPNESSNLYGFAGRTLSQHLVAGQTYVLTINGRIDAQAKADGKELRAYVWNNGWTSETSVGISATTDTTTSIVYTPTVSGEHYFAAYLFTSGGSRLGNATLNWMKFESGSEFSGYTPAPEDSITASGKATFGVSQNGTYTYRATDALGNTKDTSINITNIDKTAPIGTTYGNPTEWTNKDFGIGLVDIVDNQSGYDYARLPNGTTMTGPNPWQTITANGTYIFTLYDKVGNPKTYTEVITKIDKAAPTANNATASTTAWTNGNVTLSLTGAADALSGFSHIVLPDGVTTVTTTNASYTATSNGTYTFKVYDKAGNVTNKSIGVSNIDKLVPSATSYGNPTTWTNTDFGLGLVDIIDVDSLYYRTKLPNGTYTTNWNPWQTITANGTYSFVVYDNAGNSKTYTEVVTKIDKTAPTGTVYGNPTAWTNTDFGIGLVDIVDSQSGYDYAKLPNGTTMTGSNPWQTITANGTYTFTLYDKVGNAKTYTEVVTKIDKVAPTGTITPSTTAWTNGNVTLTLNAADTSGSGVYRIKDHSGAYTNGAVDTFVATVNGIYNFTVYDNVGNSKVLSYAVTNIDKTAPTVNNPTASTTAWTNGTVTLSLTGAADTGGSGFSKIVLPNGTAVTTTTASQTVSVNGTYSFDVYDNAGNVTTKSITVSNIDQAAPTGVVTASPTAWTNGNVTLTLNAADTGGSGVYRIKDHTGNYTTGSVDTFVATANGTYNFTVYDNAGNSKVLSYAVTNIDKTAPTANNPTASTTAWTNGTVTLSLTGAADTGGSGFSKIVLPNGTAVTTTTASQTVSVNGTYSFNVYDNAGNVTTKSITVSNIDQAAPTGVITASPTAWTNGNVTLSLSASDLGVSGYYRTKLPNGAYTSATTFDYSVTGNGAQTFVIYDNAGNSTTVTHNVGNIDKTLPGGTIAPSTTAWTKGPITLTFSGTDAGGSNVDYVLDHASNKTIGASDSYVVSSNGTYQFTVFDKAGNSKVVSYAVSNIDLTAPGKPTIDLSTAAWTNGNVTFTIIPGTDNQSGVAYTQYQIDGGAWTNYTGVVTISTNGKHVINARTTDNVGWTGVTETKTASIDKVVPTADISVNTSWTNAASVAATLTASDADSGIATVTYQLSGATTKAATTVTSGDVISIVNEGQTTITLVATDAVGQTTTTTKVVKIDRTAPVFTSASISNVTESGFDVTVTVTDGISGVNNVNLPIWRSGNYSGMKTFPHTGQGNGTHTYHVDMADIGAGADYVYIGKHVTDNAGNSAFAGDASFKLDVTAPTLAISQADTTVWTNKDVTVSSVSSDNFNGVETLTIAGNSTTKTTDVFAKPKILSVSAASRSTVSYLIAKGYDVTVDTTVTTLAQLSGYDIILSDGQAWAADNASLLNQAYAAGYRIFSTGNDTASGAIHPVTTSSAGSGSFTLTQYANTDHVELGDYDNIMKYYDGAMEADGGQLQVTAYPSDTRVLATNTLYGTASLLYSVNNNGGKWIHLQGFGPHGTMSRRILDELMLGTKATRQTYTEALTVASNGTYTVTAEDFFGNKTNQTITVSNIDKTLPGGTITSSNTAFTNGNVTLTFAGTDAGGSGVDYVLDNASNKTIGAIDSYVVSSNGTYHFTIYDKAGNSKAVSYTVSNIDKSAPNATIASNVTGWTNQNVILTVSPTDVGVSGYYRTLLPNGTYSTAANPTFTVSGNGNQTFVIYDNAGNSTTVTYNVGNIDKTLPGGTIAPSTTAWMNADVTLTLNATDVGGSGVDRVMNPSGVVTSGATASFTATTNGTFSFTVYDKAGNTKVVTYVVANIDKIKPDYTGNIAITNVTQDYFDVVITNVSDAQSGMNRVQFPTWTNANGQDDLGDWWSTTEYKGSESTTTYTYRVQRSSHKDEFGLYNVHIYLFDNAGNYITVATSYVLRDQVFPLVDSITGNPTIWTNQNATLTVNGHDEHTGVKSITLPDGTVVATNSAKGANATANYTVSANGSYTFKITDMYDNVTTQTVNVSKIDKVLPSATTQGNPVNWTNQNQTLTITGSDAGGSGFKQIKLPSGVIVSGSSATYTVSQNGSYSFVVYDNAGNSRTISEQVTKIDKETPGGGITGNPVNWTNQNATLTLNAADTGGAGVKGVYLPNGTFVTTTSVASYVATQNGTYTFKTVDFAGNETSVSATVTKIDKVAPTVASVGGNPMQWTNVSQVLRVTGADGLSGMASIKRPDNSVVTGAMADYTVHQNGSYVFVLTDVAGNSATHTVDVTKIDKGNPSQSSVNISVTNSQQ